jgi:ElaB/YqjD/DUF883 family membrane-anchored ribosome-binding protein
MADRRNKNTPKDISVRLGALRTEFDALQKDVKGLAVDTGDAANGRVHLAMRAAENVAERAFRLAEDAASHLAKDVETWTDDNLECARNTVRAQPFSAIALSMGAGAILGAILFRR